ncbi:hypothetical protein [Desulfolucanica intricata]|uniref:hypothetical protein n=1 Tax=Desulfolucanica intricata TaxID=1285191 RepID=UPI0008339A44|nr:hypothetical protein [Desulfolucanica intricata]
MNKWKFRNKKNGKIPRSEMQKYIEENIYNIYWRWSIITYILFNDPVQAQEVMNTTVNKIDGYEKTARKVILKIFTEIAVNPSEQIKRFIQYSIRQETISEQNTNYKQTKQLLKHLQERKMISETEYEDWLNKIDCIK